MKLCIDMIHDIGTLYQGWIVELFVPPLLNEIRSIILALSGTRLTSSQWANSLTAVIVSEASLRDGLTLLQVLSQMPGFIGETMNFQAFFSLTEALLSLATLLQQRSLKSDLEILFLAEIFSTLSSLEPVLLLMAQLMESSEEKTPEVQNLSQILPVVINSLITVPLKTLRGKTPNKSFSSGIVLRLSQSASTLRLISTTIASNDFKTQQKSAFTARRHGSPL